MAAGVKGIVIHAGADPAGDALNIAVVVIAFAAAGRDHQSKGIAEAVGPTLHAAIGVIGEGLAAAAQGVAPVTIATIVTVDIGDHLVKIGPAVNPVTRRIANGLIRITVCNRGEALVAVVAEGPADRRARSSARIVIQGGALVSKCVVGVGRIGHVGESGLIVGVDHRLGGRAADSGKSPQPVITVADGDRACAGARRGGCCGHIRQGNQGDPVESVVTITRRPTVCW